MFIGDKLVQVMVATPCKCFHAVVECCHLLLCCVKVVNEVKDSSDARELLLGSILQADMLTQVVNKRITAEHVQQRQPEDTAAGMCCVESSLTLDLYTEGLLIVFAT